ncbi:MAG: hypothetical protein DCC51_14915, partial [Anaerolineae bacterium]
WGEGRVDRSVVRDLIDRKATALRQELPDGEAWRFHYAVFSREGLTPAAAADLRAQGGLDVSLARLDAELS